MDKIDINFKKELEKQLIDIYQCVLSHHQHERHIGGLVGKAGVALFSLIYEKYFGISDQSFSLDLINSSVEKINNGYSDFSYCQGLTGFGITLCIISSENLLDDNFSPLLEELDIPLETKLYNDLEKGNYDLLDGGIGLALYFLKRYELEKTEKKIKFKNILLKTIDLLEDRSVSTKGEKKWKDIQHNSMNYDIYNLGLAHGNASIATFLAKINNIEDLKSFKVLNLLRGSMRFLINSMRPDGSKGFFPNHIDSSGTSLQPPESRLGWCYGDLGISTALWQVALSLDADYLKEKCVELWQHSIERKSLLETGVNDISLCHGAFGNALIFKHINNSYPSGQIESTAWYWLKIGKDMLTNNPYYWKIPFHTDSGAINNNFSLLQGLPGAGLTIISFLDNQPSPLEEFLLLK